MQPAKIVPVHRQSHTLHLECTALWVIRKGRPQNTLNIDPSPYLLLSALDHTPSSPPADVCKLD